MNWYWKVRVYNTNGFYGTSQIKTGRNLEEINVIQDFYKELTGCKMLLEGMSEIPYENISYTKDIFQMIWKTT